MTFDHAGKHQAPAKIMGVADCAVTLPGRRDRNDLAAADGDFDQLAISQPRVLEQCVDGGQLRSPVSYVGTMPSGRARENAAISPAVVIQMSLRLATIACRARRSGRSRCGWPTR